MERAEREGRVSGMDALRETARQGRASVMVGSDKKHRSEIECVDGHRGGAKASMVEKIKVQSIFLMGHILKTLKG